MNIYDYTNNYLEPGFESKQVAYRRRFVLEQINRYHPKRILEIGCGIEPLIAFLPYNPDKYVIVEPSDFFAENAIKKRTGIEGEKEYVSSSFEVINDYFKADREYSKYDFDFIVCSSLFHLVEDPNDIIHAIRMASNDNTITHINVPNADSFHRILAQKAGLINSTNEFSDRDKKFQHQRVYDIDNLTELVALNGFEVIEKGSYFVKPFSHNQMQRLLDEKIIDERVLDGLYSIIDLIPGMGSEIFVNCKKN